MLTRPARRPQQQQRSPSALARPTDSPVRVLPDQASVAAATAPQPTGPPSAALKRAAFLYFRRLYGLEPWDLLHFLRTECSSNPALVEAVAPLLRRLRFHPKLVRARTHATDT
jgi:hypothetical protein